MFVTNHPKTVLAAIDAIAATSSRNEKEALMREAGASSRLFVKVLQAAYDPLKNYYITQPPHKREGIAPGENSLDEPLVWNLLESLSNRTLSGNEARERIQHIIDVLDDASAELLRRILRKDLRAGFSADTINRVFKGLLPDFPYMRCSLPDKSDMPKWDAAAWSAGIISQEKADGMFVNVNVTVDGVHLFSRQGSPIPTGAMPQLRDAIAFLVKPGTQSHGELTVYEGGVLLPREQGNGVLNSIIQGGALPDNHVVRLDLWDQIPLEAVQSKGRYEVPYKSRLRGLIEQLRIGQDDVPPWVRKHVGLVPTRIVKSKDQAIAHYRELLGKGKEGTILKHPDAIWRDGTSKQQVKMKLEVDLDLIVEAVVPGTPGTRTEGRPGALLCRSGCGRLQVSVAVKNEAMRDRIEANPDDWVGRVMAVRANSLMQPSKDDEPYSLFLPRFVEADYRLDKAVADDLQRVQDIFRNAMGVKA